MTQANKGTDRSRRSRSPGCCEELEDLLDPELFRALCDPSRCDILQRLATTGAALTVSEVAEGCPTDLSVVSRHLSQLRKAGILLAERRGRQVFYRVEYAPLIRRLRTLADALERCCGESRPAGAEEQES